MHRVRPGSHTVGLFADLRLWWPMALALSLSAIFAGSSALSPGAFSIVLVAAWSACIAVINSNCTRRRLTKAAWLMGLAIAAIPLAQMIPIPLRAAGALAGQGPLIDAASFLQINSWHPLTLDIESTWHSFLLASGYVAIFWGAATLSPSGRVGLIYLVLALAMAGLLLGFVQVVHPDARFYLQPDAVRGTLTGFFGNRNHESDLLVIAAGLAVALAGASPVRLQRLILYAFAVVFAAGVIATRSRAGILLLFVLAGMLLLQRSSSRKVSVLSAGAVVSALLALIFFTPVGHMSFLRFLGEGGSFDRILIWRESLFALREVFPVGSGAGTFAQAYASVEALEDVSGVFINHAHSEVLQVPIELGLPGVMLVGGALVSLAIRFVQLGRQGEKLSQAVLCCLAVPILHSLVDYPLRDFAIGSVACLLLSFAFASRSSVHVPTPVTRHSSSRTAIKGTAIYKPRVWLTAVGLLLVGLVAQTGIADILVGEGRPALALRITPLSSRAHLARAQQLIGDRQRVGEATYHAQRALWLNTYSARAWALIGYSALQRGDIARADSAFLNAARLGWRDEAVQGYVFRRAVETGSAETAARAADALLRRNAASSQAVMDQVINLLPDAGFRDAIAIRLAESPSWKSIFLARLNPENQVQAAAQIELFRTLARHKVPLAVSDALGYLERSNASGALPTVLDEWRLMHGAKAGDPQLSAIDGAFQFNDRSLFPFGWLPKDGKLAQVVALRPGSYSLSLNPPDGGKDSDGHASPRLDISCGERGKGASVEGIRTAGIDSKQTVRGTITIPPKRCALQILSIGPAAEIR